MSQPARACDSHGDPTMRNAEPSDFGRRQGLESISVLKLTRRRFAFWIGLGLFSAGEKLRASGFDDLAAAVMQGTDAPRDSKPETPEHWTTAQNRTWRWYERENLKDGEWELTGITRPVHKRTGELAPDREGYLDESLVPEDVRLGGKTKTLDELLENATEADAGQPSVERKARHGRPPSKWLRSLNADELRIWMATIEVPEAGVSGMTFWTHLTRDHSFDPIRIEGLTIDEQAKLHAAAHFGY